MMKVLEAKIETLEGGAIVEAANVALEKVWTDLVDLDKKDDAVRTVTISIDVMPGKGGRQKPVWSANVKTKLAPFRDIEGSTLYIKRDGGKLRALDVDPEQLSLGLEMENVEAIDSKGEKG